MLNKIGSNLLVLTLLMLLGGCASMTHFNEQRTAGKNKVFFIDAKQRGVYSVKKTQDTVSWEGICAEPAPDAISALAATLGVDLTLTDKGKLGLSNSIAESVGSIGIRTAAISALRDIMYRNCEAYALGGISNIGIETLQRRFQSTMVAILAIEQLTGAVRSPAVILASTSSAGSPDAILDLTNKSESARKSFEDAKSAEAKSKEKYGDAVTTKKDTEKKIQDGKTEADRIRALPTPSDAERKTLADYDELSNTLEKNNEAESTLKNDYVIAQETTKGREQAYNALETSRTAALTGGGKTGSSGVFEAQTSKATLSDTAAIAVARAVKDIVYNTTSGLHFSDELCTTLLGQYANVTPTTGSALSTCISKLHSGAMHIE